jgi:diguanylate cyclase (GGDEF)-like protein/PAS domain S-box-containing protein
VLVRHSSFRYEQLWKVADNQIVRSRKNIGWSRPWLDKLNNALRQKNRIEASVCLEARTLMENSLPAEGGKLLCPPRNRTLDLRGFIENTSGQKTTEQTSTESEGRFRGIFEENGSVMLLVEPHSGEIIDANPAASAYYGYAREQLIGLPIVQINTLPPDEISREMQRALHEKRNYFNFCHRLASGQVRDVEVYSSPIDVSGRALLISIVHDITNRKRVEEALRESLDSLKEAQVIGSLGSYVLDLSSQAWTSSDVLDRIFGIDQEYQHTAAGWLALVSPLDRVMVETYFTGEVLGEAKDFDKEYRIVRQTDLKERWVYGKGRVEFDDHGNLLKLRGIIRDITERKLSEIQLRDSEERYRAIFDQAAVGIVTTSFDGRFLMCNARFAEIIGYPIEEVSGLTFEHIMAPEEFTSRPSATQIAMTAVVGSSSRERQYVCKDGSFTRVKVTTSSQCDSQGRAVDLISVVEDVNARRVAEEQLATAQRALKRDEERYRSAFQTSLDSININRLADGVYIEVNDSFVKGTGFARQEVIGRTSTEVGIWADPLDRQKLIDTLREKSTCLNLEVQFTKKNGDLVWGMISASVFELEGVACILSVTRDISEAKAASQRLADSRRALQSSEKRYRAVFDTSLDCITISNLSDGRYVDVNKAFLDLTGFEREDIIGRTSQELKLWKNPSERSRVIQMLRKTSCTGDIRTGFKRKDGDVLPVLVSASVIEIEGVESVVSVVRDLSDAKIAEQKISKLAYYDPLTGLPNRSLLLDRLRRILVSRTGRDTKRALLFVDLDNFKTLNDTFGHQTGDLLLQEVAGRISACVRSTDTVARFGADEHVVIIGELSNSTEDAATRARTVGEKILAAVCKPYSLDGHEFRSTASVGITVFGEVRISADEVLQHAAIAMHQAKADGGNTIHFFNSALQAAVNARASMEEDLRQAIAGNQFLLHYQPQIERGRLTGAEALIRWNHPRLGILAPLEFIPLAEDTGLILPLGNWVLEAASAQVAAWAHRTETANITIAVNISARQFRQADFVKQLLATLDRTGVSPGSLKLELTESMLLVDIEDVIAKMTELRSHGLRLSLDDFGTGYSSLSYLKRLPLAELKIDRAFVRDILADATSGAIAQTIISLGRALGLSVIAEGVETEEQRDCLAGLGCHSFQGYLFSRPLPPEEFELLLSSFSNGGAKFHNNLVARGHLRGVV